MQRKVAVWDTEFYKKNPPLNQILYIQDWARNPDSKAFYVEFDDTEQSHCLDDIDHESKKYFKKNHVYLCSTVNVLEFNDRMVRAESIILKEKLSWEKDLGYYYKGNHFIDSGNVTVCGNAVVHCSDNAEATMLSGNATLFLKDVARGDIICGYCVATDNATVVQAITGIVYAYDDAKVSAEEQVVVHAYDRAYIEATGEAEIHVYSKDVMIQYKNFNGNVIRKIKC
jgi:hypothetical protein